MLFGRSQANLPSRFLKEIPEELLETPAKSKRQTMVFLIILQEFLLRSVMVDLLVNVQITYEKLHV
jgi:hypothetical protein